MPRRVYPAYLADRQGACRAFNPAWRDYFSVGVAALDEAGDLFGETAWWRFDEENEEPVIVKKAQAPEKPKVIDRRTRLAKLLREAVAKAEQGDRRAANDAFWLLDDLRALKRSDGALTPDAESGICRMQERMMALFSQERLLEPA